MTRTSITKRSRAAGLLGPLALLLAAAAIAAPGAGAAQFVPGPCPQTPAPIPELKTASCGQLIVPEDRGEPGGKTIRLSVATIPAKAAIPKPDPIVWLAGGPGDDSILEIPMAMAGELNRNRDVIFMSQRGTYTAKPPLTCLPVDRWAEETLNMPYDAPATGRAYVAATKKCRAQLAARGVDLGAYNTLESANDLEELRQALGVAQWNLYGISYGTDLALNLMRMHPQGIRSVGIDGVFPPPLAGGVASWTSAGEGINAIFRSCQADPRCRSRYGDIGATFRRLVRKYERAPESVRVPVDGVKGLVPVTISGGMLLQWTVSPGTHLAGKVPAAIDALAHGDPEPIASTWAAPKLNPAGLGVLGNGLFYGVSCGEWVPYESEASVIAAGRRAFPSFSRSLWANAPNLPFMRQNCAAWKVPKVAAEVREVTRSPIPTLVVSAQYDGQTAASFGPLVARTLPNATAVTIPNVAHVAFASPSPKANACTQRIVRSFIDAPGKAKTGCIAKVPPIEFEITKRRAGAARR
ncbi:MAG TPA: alpha/beta hydrolase [Solirubrobacterales bacterium]|nr:alpha/beta hydrolase [Solirubrobacterales bacterium]